MLSWDEWVDCDQVLKKTDENVELAKLVNDAVIKGKDLDIDQKLQGVDLKMEEKTQLEEVEKILPENLQSMLVLDFEERMCAKV